MPVFVMSEEVSNVLSFYVNGQLVEDANPDPGETLLHYIRRKHEQSHRSQAACITPVVSVHGQEITTVEGLSLSDSSLHPVQEQLAKTHGTQCGFCSPGFVMGMYSLLQNNPEPSLQQMETALGGNVCRCTGYRPILQGMRTFCQNCPEKKAAGDIEDVGSIAIKQKGFYDQTTDEKRIEAIVQRVEQFVRSNTKTYQFRGKDILWLQPSSIEKLVQLRADHPDSIFLSGASTLKYLPKKPSGNVYISTTAIPEFKKLQICTEYPKMRYLYIGAGVTIAELKQFIENSNEKPGGVLHAMLSTLSSFHSPSVSNVGTVAGSLAGASPTSDLNVFLLSASAEVGTRGHGAIRMGCVNHNFFPGYRKTVLRPQEVITHVRVPLTDKNVCAESYKEGTGNATVTASMMVAFDDNLDRVESAKFAFGGIGPTPLLASKLEQYLVGEKWTAPDSSSMEWQKVLNILLEEMRVPKGSPGGAEDYRNCLIAGTFLRFCTSVTDYLCQHGATTVPNVDRSVLPTRLDAKEGIQVFEKPMPKHDSDTVGSTITNVSSRDHVRGLSQYVDDIPRFKNELSLVFLTSPRPCAKLLSVDNSKALQMPGVKAIFGADELGGANLPWLTDLRVFAEKKVMYHGQAILAVVADTREQANAAAKAVEMEFEDIRPILGIKDAIKCGSFLEEPHVFPPDAQDPLQGASSVLEGELEMGPQKHIYMEAQSVLAVPKNEKEEMDIYISAQGPAIIQEFVCKALNVDKNRVAIKVKRLGGGFGGKIIDPLLLAIPVAFASKRLKKPVRCVLDMQEDMLMIGGRPPVLAKYKAGYDIDGRVDAIDVDVYLDGGAFQRIPLKGYMSLLVLLPSAYSVPRGRITLHACKTNVHPSTAVRGVTAPTGTFIMEHIMHSLSESLSLPAEQVRGINLLRGGDTPFTGQVIEDPSARECFDEVIRTSSYRVRREEVAAFNQSNRWRKQGIAVVPIGHGLQSGGRQVSALLHVYKDGSVLLGHSGVEMGQGLNTKMIQIVTRALGVPLQKVHTKETNTDVSIEGTQTGASLGTDLNGMAVKKCCEEIAARLEPFKQKEPNGSWEDWVKASYTNGVDLSVSQSYRAPTTVPTFPGGLSHSYMTYGAACSLVEVDCLTGNTKVLQTDILMDIGKSINPMIDIGQIEGGFLCGYGLLMMEEELFRPDGTLITTGLGTYQVPRLKDIPQKFNISLLKERDNPFAVYSSKGIGEPPVSLASSVYFATRMAVLSARKDAGLDPFFVLNTPATPERVRLACGDRLTVPK